MYGLAAGDLVRRSCADLSSRRVIVDSRPERGVGPSGRPPLSAQPRGVAARVACVPGRSDRVLVLAVMLAAVLAFLPGTPADGGMGRPGSPLSRMARGPRRAHVSRRAARVRPLGLLSERRAAAARERRSPRRPTRDARGQGRDGRSGLPPRAPGRTPRDRPGDRRVVRRVLGRAALVLLDALRLALRHPRRAGGPGHSAGAPAGHFVDGDRGGVAFGVAATFKQTTGLFMETAALVALSAAGGVGHRWWERWLARLLPVAAAILIVAYLGKELRTGRGLALGAFPLCGLVVEAVRMRGSASRDSTAPAVIACGVGFLLPLLVWVAVYASFGQLGALIDGLVRLPQRLTWFVPLPEPHVRWLAMLGVILLGWGALAAHRLRLLGDVAGRDAGDRGARCHCRHHGRIRADPRDDLPAARHRRGRRPHRADSARDHGAGPRGGTAHSCCSPSIRLATSRTL